jgi:hypothetical protein
MQSSNSTVWQSGPDVDGLDQRLLDDLEFSQEFAEVMQYVVITYDDQNLTLVFIWSLKLDANAT